MKLTVDASVVVKWFLTEPQSDEARRLLTPRFHLHAPDILLAEYANTIRKKVHRNEISSPQPYFDEITGNAVSNTPAKWPAWTTTTTRRVMVSTGGLVTRA